MAASVSLQEIDVGSNALTSMPAAWMQGNASHSSLTYIAMDSNAIAVSPSPGSCQSPALHNLVKRLELSQTSVGADGMHDTVKDLVTLPCNCGP